MHVFIWLWPQCSSSHNTNYRQFSTVSVYRSLNVTYCSIFRSKSTRTSSSTRLGEPHTFLTSRIGTSLSNTDKDRFSLLRVSLSNFGDRDKDSQVKVQRGTLPDVLQKVMLMNQRQERQPSTSQKGRSGSLLILARERLCCTLPLSRCLTGYEDVNLCGLNSLARS